MNRLFFISFVYLFSSYCWASDGHKDIESFQAFLDESDLDFVSESDSEEFNFLKVVINDKLSVKADLKAVANASSILRNIVKTRVGQERETDGDLNYQLTLRELKYSSNGIKLLRLMVKGEFIPYTDEVISSHPDIMYELLWTMESYGLDSLSYVIASACQESYFSPATTKVVELLFESNPNSQIVQSAMASLCWNSLSKPSIGLAETSSDAQMFKHFVTNNFDDLCQRFPFFIIGSKAFQFENLLQTFVKQIVERSQKLSWGERADLSFTEKELEFLKFVIGKKPLYGSNRSSSNLISMENNKPRFGLGDLHYRLFDHSALDLGPDEPVEIDTDILKNAPREVILLYNLKNVLAEHGLEMSLRQSYIDTVYAKTFYYVEIKK